ncbi:MAG: hypothetical protein HQ578_07065 [Chloroflexi bacterium]|nr:hypothetical protein [Chloroflexota bacterium]
MYRRIVAVLEMVVLPSPGVKVFPSEPGKGCRAGGFHAPRGAPQNTEKSQVESWAAPDYTQSGNLGVRSVT